ncbi:MaoC family dehydratase [Chloroflexota bacterium]
MEITYDNVEVGQELSTITYELTPERVRWYLEEAEETNPIYSDAEIARRGGLGGPVAPPIIACVYAPPPEIISALGYQFPAHTIHAASEFTFVKPARSGDVITSKARIRDKYLKKGRKYTVMEVKSFNQDGELILINIHTSLWPK